MNIFGGFKESSDVSDVNKENKPEISQDAQSKFEKIMGDERLAEADKNESSASTFSNLLDKFENLFKSEAVANTENAKTDAEMDSDVADEISQPHEHNSEYKIDGAVYGTDDMGTTYMKDGVLLANAEYTLNGNIYTTDERGRIICCEAQPERSPENPRDVSAQLRAGGEDRCPSDQGGHIIGRDLNGDGGVGNLIAMNSKINQSDYKRMENDIKAVLDEGKEIETKTEMTYNVDSERPDIIKTTVTVEGNDTVYEFDNNIDGSLDEKISEKSPIAKELLDEYMDAHISSVKCEYNENSELVKTTAYITYIDHNGNNLRKPVIISNTYNGGCNNDC